MLLSIDVGRDSFFAVEGNYGAGVVSVAKAGEMRFPKGTVEDGSFKYYASFITSLNKLLMSNGFRANASCFTINSSSILSRRLELPASKPRDMAKMVRNEMLQTVNETNEYAFDYSIINDNSPNPKVKNVWAYAIPKDIVDEYYSIFKYVKLKPIALDIHTNSVEKLLLNAVVNGKQQIGGNSVLFVNIEEEEVEIHLLSEGQRAFSRVMPGSSYELKVLCGNAGLLSESGGFESLDITEDRFVNDQILSGCAHQYLNNIAGEIQKMVQFQMRRNASNPVTNVFIYGSMSCIIGVAQSIGSILGISTENLETLSNVKSKGIKIAKYINAIGSLIRL